MGNVHRSCPLKTTLCSLLKISVILKKFEKTAFEGTWLGTTLIKMEVKEQLVN